MDKHGARLLMQHLQAAVNGAETAAATKALQSAGGSPGVAICLLQIGLAPNIDFGVRQLALLVLRQHIRAHWTLEGHGFQKPVIQDSEKAAVRAQLPQGLADADSKLRTAAGLAVAAIAKWDCPNEWPNLLDDLLKAIDQSDNKHLVHGALQCLSLFADELDDDQIIQAAPFLFPQLLRIVQTSHPGAPAVTRHALSVLYSLLSVLVSVLDDHRAEVKALVQPTLAGWCEQLSLLLATPLRQDTMPAWGGVHKALETLTLLTAHFGKDVAPHMPALATHIWQMFSGSLPLYEATAVRSEHELAPPPSDSDAEETPQLGEVLAQVLELLVVLADARRFRPLLASGLPQLLQLCIGYMQLTEAQVEDWEADVNVMISDEEQGGTGVRVSAEALLQSLVVNCGAAATAALSEALQGRLAEAASRQVAGSEHWWQLREAALLAAGDAHEALLDDGGGDASGIDVSSLLDHVLAQEFAEGATPPPFLAGRALWLASKCASAISPQQAERCLAVAAAHLSSDSPPVQVGAMAAVLELAQECGSNIIRPHLAALYSEAAPRLVEEEEEDGLQAAGAQRRLKSTPEVQGLGGVLEKASEEQLHEVLQALKALVDADKEAAVAWEHAILPGTLKVWEQNVTDPLVVMSALEVLEALAAIPACLDSLQAHVVPPLASILAQPNVQPDMLVEGALDLLTSVLRPSTAEGAARVHSAASQHVLAMLQSSDDAGILQSCCCYWRVMLRVGGEAVLGGGEGVAALASGLARPLQPALGDSAAYSVGYALLALLRAAPGAVAPAIPGLLAAVTAKLVAAESSPVLTGLLLVVAKLMCLYLRDTLACLASQPHPSGGQRSALEAVMSIWADRQMEFHGSFQIKLSAIALASLLTADNPALDQIQVKGRRLDTGDAIRTRSRAKAQEEQWDAIPLRLKLFLLAADALAEAQAQVQGTDGNDESWEEASDSGDEGSAAGKVTKPSLEDILAQAVAEETEDDHLADQDLADDPVSSVDLAEVLESELRRFAAADAGRFSQALQYLTQPQREALQKYG